MFFQESRVYSRVAQASQITQLSDWVKWMGTLRVDTWLRPSARGGGHDFWNGMIIQGFCTEKSMLVSTMDRADVRTARQADSDEDDRYPRSHLHGTGGVLTAAVWLAVDRGISVTSSAWRLSRSDDPADNGQTPRAAGSQRILCCWI